MASLVGTSVANAALSSSGLPFTFYRFGVIAPELHRHLMKSITHSDVQGRTRYGLEVVGSRSPCHTQKKVHLQRDRRDERLQ